MTSFEKERMSFGGVEADLLNEYEYENEREFDALSARISRSSKLTTV